MPTALLEHETVDGEEVGRLVDEAYGRPVHESDTVRHLPSAADRGHGERGAGAGASTTGSGVTGGTASGSAQSRKAPGGDSHAGDASISPPD